MDPDHGYLLDTDFDTGPDPELLLLLPLLQAASASEASATAEARARTRRRLVGPRRAGVCKDKVDPADLFSSFSSGAAPLNVVLVIPEVV